MKKLLVLLFMVSLLTGCNVQLREYTLLDSEGRGSQAYQTDINVGLVTITAGRAGLIVWDNTEWCHPVFRLPADAPYVCA